MKKMLLAVLVVALCATPTLAAETSSSVWSPQFGLDILQPGYNLQGSTRSLHLTLGGAHLSLLRIGQLRFPTVGLDYQLRFSEHPGVTGLYDPYSSQLGFFLLSTGVKYRVNDSSPVEGGPGNEWGIHVKGQYATRVDPDPRVGRWGITTGVYFGF